MLKERKFRLSLIMYFFEMLTSVSCFCQLTLLINYPRRTPTSSVIAIVITHSVGWKIDIYVTLLIII